MNWEDKVKALTDLVIYFKDHINELDLEINRVQSLLQITEDMLVEKSFREAEKIKLNVSESSETLRDNQKSIPLKTSTGTLLANMYLNDKQVKIIPSDDMRFDINTPPFKAFMIDRILDPATIESKDAIEKDKEGSDEAFSYKIDLDNNIIREITIRNFNNERHLREIKSSLTWTLEKMWERTLTLDS